MRAIRNRLERLEQAVRVGSGTGATVRIDTASMGDNEMRAALRRARREVGQHGCVIVDGEVPGIPPVVWIRDDDLQALY